MKTEDPYRPSFCSYILHSCSKHLKFALNYDVYNLSFLVLSIICDSVNLLTATVYKKLTVHSF